MNTCQSCKHWKRQRKVADYKAINKKLKIEGKPPIEPWPLNFGKCTAAHIRGGIMNQDSDKMIFTEICPTQYGQIVEIMTNENFGCILHTEKP